MLCVRMTLLNQERQEKQKLLDTIEHYKKNLVTLIHEI